MKRSMFGVGFCALMLLSASLLGVADDDLDTNVALCHNGNVIIVGAPAAAVHVAHGDVPSTGEPGDKCKIEDSLPEQ